MRGVGLKIPERRFYQVALLIVVAGLVSNCSLLWGEAVSEMWRDGNLTLRLWVSKRQPTVGQCVTIKYTVENRTDGIEVIQLKEKQEPVMDIRIHFGLARHSMTTLYWSDGREITPEMRRLELAPGESKTIEMTWVPDEKADRSPVSVHGILNREQMRQYVPVHICVGVCGGY